MNSYDIDGVIYIKGYEGLTPTNNDIIITGRSYEEREETLTMLRERGITNRVYFNSLPYSKRSREASGQHKARLIKFINSTKRIGIHFEDDPIQAEIIQRIVGNATQVVLIQHDLTKKSR